MNIKQVHAILTVQEQRNLAITSLHLIWILRTDEELKKCFLNTREMNSLLVLSKALFRLIT